MRPATPTLADLAPELAGAVVVDGHTDVPTRLLYEPADLSRRQELGHVDLPRLREGGLTSPFFALYVPPFLSPEAGWRHAMRLHALVEEQLRPGEMELAVTAEEVRSKTARGVVTVLLCLENGRPLAGPEDVRKFAELGVRYVTLTHVKSHEWCDASTDTPVHGGLSDVGVKIVREMRRLGILVDASHVSDDAALHAMDAVRAPIVASHSSARALCDHPRNLPDSLVLEIARGGGIVMANAYPAFLDPEAARAAGRRTAEIVRRFAERDVSGPEAMLDAFYEVYREVVTENPLPPVPLSLYVDHIQHLVEVAGEEHVGIGTDFDGIPDVPVGLEDASRMPALAQALLERGMAPRVVRMILGENFLRVLEDSERRAG